MVTQRPGSGLSPILHIMRTMKKNAPDFSGDRIMAHKRNSRWPPLLVMHNVTVLTIVLLADTPLGICDEGRHRGPAIEYTFSVDDSTLHVIVLHGD